VSLFAQVGRVSDNVRLRQRSGTTVELRVQVSAIIARVRREGDTALAAMAQELDGLTLDPSALEVSRGRWERALASTPPELRRAMERSARNIRAASEAFMPTLCEVETEPGVVVGKRPDPLERVGVYVPGGRASYPSSLLMGAIPARVAGVRDVIVCTPGATAATLAAAAIAGVDRVFEIGGAGAIAALAYGTVTVPAVDKIVGPGNAYVTEAKLQVLGECAIDSPAGPSELLVIMDDSADVAAVAREMIAQAEHDPRAVVAAVAIEGDGAEVSARLMETVRHLVRADAQGPDVIARRDIVLAALRSGGAVLSARCVDEAIRFANAMAAEHVLVATREPDCVLAQLRNAGTVFVGVASSVTFGDYMTGANHVLPTSGFARSYSGLSVLDFLRWTSYQRVTRDAAARLADDVALFAEAEALYGHATAARSWG
jgi:histidinol dehydrogenase